MAETKIDEPLFGPGDGYRFLKKGEYFLKTDEWSANGGVTWFARGKAGGFFDPLRCWPCRRKIEGIIRVKRK